MNENQAKNKILFFTQSLGGVEVYIRDIISYIDRTKFEIVLVAPHSESFKNFCEENGVVVYNLKMARGFNILTDVLTIVRFARIIMREKPKLLHLHSSKAGFLGRITAKLCGKPAIVTPHGASYLSFTGTKRAVFFMLEVVVKPFTKMILAVSHSEAYRMRFEVGHSADKIQVVLNATNFVNAFEPRKYALPGGKVKIGTIARLTYQKNPLLFVEVAKLVCENYPNVEFEILGAGLEDHLIEDVKALITKYGLDKKVVISKWGSYESAGVFLNGLDFFLLTSIFEGLPLSLLEAMALGIPSIVSKCDGCNDVIQNNVNGFSCITAREFYEALSSLMDEPQLAERIGASGAQYVKEHHNILKSVRQVEAVYTGMLSAKV